MKNKFAKAEPSPQTLVIHWPAVIISFLVGATAFGLVAVQFQNADDPANQLALANLNQRVPLLESLTNWVERDRYCVPLSASARQLDRALAPDARVFLTGMLGLTNAPRAGYYYFLRNYLFPRDVEISLDGHAVSGKDGFSGVPCDSPEVLRTNGFDLMIDSDNMQMVPLTPKGVPRSQ